MREELERMILYYNEMADFCSTVVSKEHRKHEAIYRDFAKDLINLKKIQDAEDIKKKA